MVAPNFPCSCRQFPRSLQENSLFRCVGNFVGQGTDSARVFGLHLRRDFLQIAKIPCKFPYIREFWGGDRFVGDYVHHHAFLSEPTFPGLWQNARNLRPFSRFR